MERSVEDFTILDKFIKDIAAIIEKHAKYIVVSGFVSIAHGRSRGTEDIDMIVEKMSKNNFFALHNGLKNGGFVCIQSDDATVIYQDYLLEGISVRYVRDGNSFAPPELELKFAKDEIDNMQLANRKKYPLTGLDIWFSTIEMNIAFKEDLLKSDKDLADAKHLRILYAGKINEDEIKDAKLMIRRIRLGDWND